MHDCGIAAGDAWLSREVAEDPRLRAYKQGGALFVTFNESAGIGRAHRLHRPLAARQEGLREPDPYTHSSMLRSLQEIFGVAPLLGDAANAANLSDLFRSFP